MKITQVKSGEFSVTVLQNIGKVKKGDQLIYSIEELEGEPPAKKAKK